MGPAPTREPRMALLPDAIVAPPSDSDVELGDESEHHDARDPHQGEDDRDAVQVALSNTRRAEARRDAAAEHVGQTATAALVQQDEQRQQEARETEQHLQDDLENLHGEPFRARQRGSVPTFEY